MIMAYMEQGGNVLSQVFKRVDVSKILRTVDFDIGFHFCTNSGAYTGLAATNLNEFEEKLECIDVDSVEYRYPRSEFQLWVSKTIGDEELGNRLCFIDRKVQGENLGRKILRLINERISELTSLLEDEEEIRRF
jgi:hypothetical protein